MPGCSLENTLADFGAHPAEVEALPYVTRAGRERHVTISLGCAVFPNTATTLRLCSRRADRLCLKLSGQGKPGYIAYAGEFRGAAVAHQQPQLERFPSGSVEKSLEVARDLV